MKLQINQQWSAQRLCCSRALSLADLTNFHVGQINNPLITIEFGITGISIVLAS
jgi:hypothetical protein